MAQGNYEVDYAEMISRIVKGYSEILVSWMDNYVLPFYGKLPENMQYLSFQNRVSLVPAPQPVNEIASDIIEIQISSEKIRIQS